MKMQGKSFKWIVLVGAFLSVLTSGGFSQSIGLFVTEWQEEFDVSAEQIGWIGSCYIFGFALAGLLIATFSSLISCRGSTMFGGATSCMCLSLTYLVVTPGQLRILMTVTGFGLGCALNGGLTVIGHHFKSNIGVINGVLCSGGSFGLLVLPPLFRYLIDMYSWRGAMLIIAGIAANVCVYGALFRSKQSNERFVAKKKKQPSSSSDDNELARVNETIDNERFSKGRLYSVHNWCVYQQTDTATSCSMCSTTSTENSSSCSQEHYESRFRQLITGALQHIHIVALFTNSRVMLICFSQCLRGFGHLGAMVYFVSLAVDNDISKTRATFLLSLMGVTGTIVRLGHGIILDKKLITPIHLQSITLVIGGGSCLLIAFSRVYATFTAFAVIFGTCSGIFNMMAPNILRGILDAHLVQAALGLNIAVTYLGSLTGVPIVGALFDATQNYAASYYVAGSVLIAGGLIQLADHLLVGRQREKQEEDICKDVGYPHC